VQDAADQAPLNDYRVSRHEANEKEKNKMLYWALVFFIITIIAVVFGFGGIAAGAASIAKILFFIFLVAFVVTLLLGLVGKRPVA